MAGAPPRPLLLRALEIVGEPGEGATAIDLGCGEGRDTVELLRRGWRVLAIDAEGEAVDRLRGRPDLRDGDRLETRVESFGSVMLPSCRLLNAAYALPFCPPQALREVWGRCVGAIEPGGLFVGQWLGDRDGWATRLDMTCHARGDLDGLFSQFVIEHLQEEERDGADPAGFAKHWHVFHIIARRRRGGGTPGGSLSCAS